MVDGVAVGLTESVEFDVEVAPPVPVDIGAVTVKVALEAAKADEVSENVQ